MKIGFLLGWPEISGGTYVIYEHAVRLTRRGHTVFIITRDKVDPEKYHWHPNAGELTWLTLDAVREKAFDIILATWWESPFLLHHLDASHYIYFVQSIESRFWPPENPADHDLRMNSLGRDLCESTYTYAIPVITEATWIRKYLHENYNTNGFLVRNGVRKDLYHPEGEKHADRVAGRLRVLVEGPVDVAYKNVPRTIELCRQAGVDEVWLLTSSDVDSFPGADRVFSCVPIHDTPPIYRSCDVLVKLSFIEGMFGPPLEMFHCGGTAIVYEVTGHDEYIIHGENGYVVEPDDENRIVTCLQRLHNDPDELTRLKKGASATAAGWHDWEASSREFEQVLQEVALGEKISRAYLEHHTSSLFQQHELRISQRELETFYSRESSTDNNFAQIDNFVQLYWHNGDGWSEERCKWVHYTSGKWVTVTIELQVDSVPITLRVDPGVHIGILMLRSLKVSSLNSGNIISYYTSPGEFSKMRVAGTARPVNSGVGNVFLSYGDDPQLILPEYKHVTPGDRLEITMELKELAVGQFLNEDADDRSAAESCLLNDLRGLFRRKS